MLRLKATVAKGKRFFTDSMLLLSRSASTASISASNSASIGSVARLDIGIQLQTSPDISVTRGEIRAW